MIKVTKLGFLVDKTSVAAHNDVLMAVTRNELADYEVIRCNDENNDDRDLEGNDLNPEESDDIAWLLRDADSSIVLNERILPCDCEVLLRTAGAKGHRLSSNHVFRLINDDEVEWDSCE